MTRAIDDILLGLTPQTEEEAPEPTEKEEVSDGEETHHEEKREVQEEHQEGSADEKEDKTSEPVESADENVDEYGNPIAKSRMYTEEEVNKMMRERLARGNKNITPQQQAQVQQATKGFTPDPNSSDNWEVQLKEFIKGTVDEIQTEEKTREFQHREQLRQADFQSKFTTGMDKYSDFHKVVEQVPITDSMMMATRDMRDPAAFVYAASKTHPEEMRRIAGLGDPFQQAAEIGRLEERMKKTARITSAARPLTPTKGDIPPSKEPPKRSIDSLIHAHAKSKTR